VADIVVYTSIKAPVSYVGELVSNEKGTMTFRKALTLISDPRSQDGKIAIAPVPFASGDSLLTFQTADVPGILVTNPDDDLLKLYKKEVVGAYSKLIMV
jgi:hypothetical protein